MHPLMNIQTLTEFVAESNRIEGILRPPTEAEIKEASWFSAMEVVSIRMLVQFVSIYQPGAKLRDQFGLDVRVGRHIAPRGGPNITVTLNNILAGANTGGISPFYTHECYEHLHPFMDGNGRSGRMLWLWQMLREGWSPKLGFLHLRYYQTLDAFHAR